MLFNLYMEKAFTEAMEVSKKGIKVNGIFINNIKYADNTAIVADNIDDLQFLLDILSLAGCGYDITIILGINIKKTKTMIIIRNYHPAAKKYVAGKELERVKQFKYLGRLLNDK